MNNSKPWVSQEYRPTAYWNAMESSVKTIRSELSKEDLKRYFTSLYKFTSGVYLFHSLGQELSWLPAAVQKANESLLSNLKSCCSLGEIDFEDGDGELPAEDRSLPHPGTINARFLLQCLEHELPCPEDDFGLHINHALRESLYDLIEKALRVKLTVKIADNGFLNTYVVGDRKATALNSRDFFDSIVFNDDIAEQLETSEPLSNFFDKMRRLSTFCHQAD